MSIDSPPETLEGVVTTLAAVARAFQVSAQTVKHDWRPNGMPGSHGAYDLAQIAEWRKIAQRRNPDHAAQLMAASGAAPAKGLAEFEQRLKADVRIREAEAAKRERLNRIAEGEMIDKSLVERLWAEQVIAARERLMRLPRLMMPMFPRKHAAEYCAELQHHIDFVLNDLAEWRPSLDIVEED